MYKALLKHIGLIWFLRHPGTGLNISKSFFIYLIGIYDISLIFYDIVSDKFNMINTLVSILIINIILYAFYAFKPQDKKSSPTALLLIFISASFFRFIFNPTGFLSMLLFVFEFIVIFKISITIREKNL